MRKKLPRSINLVETINPPGDTFTIFYEWTFRIGKYLLIFVQAIVIVVFLIRLSVDRINNDLTTDINTQIDFLMQEEFRKNEGKYRNLQVFFDDLSRLESTHVVNAKKIVSVLDSIPSEINLETFSFNNNRVGNKFTIPRESYSTLISYENFLKQNPNLSEVRLNLEYKDEVIEFSVNYLINSEEVTYE